jgi:ribosomal protein L11 methyltransferase
VSERARTRARAAPWQRIALEVAAAHAEALSEALLAAGALSVDIGEACPARGTAPCANALARSRRRCLVRALAPAALDASKLLAEAAARARLAPPPFRVERVGERDWVRASQAQFGPIRVSRRLWIVPSWAEPPDPRAVRIVLDPGLAFGTGAHPTTQLALRWLERTVRGGETVIDYGCGSGILAIAALKLGAAAATGVDVEPEALLAARRNAVQNRVRARFLSAHRSRLRPAQVVVANILAAPLIVLAPLLARLTLPGGRIGLSGILAREARAVRAAYREWFDLEVAARRAGWVLLAGERRGGGVRR